MSKLDKKYLIKVDTKTSFFNLMPQFSISDNETSDMLIRISDKDSIINLKDTIIVMVAIDPNGVMSSDFIEIEKEEEGLAYCNLSHSLKNVVGSWKARLMCICNNEKIVTNTFSYKVNDDEFVQLNNEVVTDDRFGTLTEMLSRLSTIEIQETTRQTNETTREQQELARQQAMEKIKLDMTKLVEDTNLQITNNLKSNTDKIDKLVVDTTKSIDDYKTAKDIAIEDDLRQYKQNTTTKIDEHVAVKDGELNLNLETYKVSTTKDINDYKVAKNSEIDAYKATKDIEIDSKVLQSTNALKSDIDKYKVDKDTLINLKIEEVNTAKTTMETNVTNKIKEADDRITVLNTFESQLDSIVTDVGDIQKQLTEGIGDSIDDTQISKDTTWSSDKIVTYRIEQDGVSWTSKEGNFISVDDTYEYKLKEIEVFGDTWQDTNNLEDIQSVGELYVDELGREQYKIEILSANTTNIVKDENIVYEKYLNLNTGLEQEGYNDWHTKDFVKINSSRIYYPKMITLDSTVTIRSWLDIFSYDKNKKYLGNFRVYINQTQVTFDKDVQYIKINNGGVQGDKTKFKFVFSLAENHLEYIENSHHHKQTILLPCQLQKVGDVKDRLYWDSVKGKYVVEKNVGLDILNTNNITIYQTKENTVHISYGDGKYSSNRYKNLICDKYRFQTGNISTISTFDNEFISSCWSTGNGIGIYLAILKYKLPNLYNQTIIDYINSQNIKVYFQLATPTIIETNITTPITVPTYVNKTHVYINNSNNAQATIKAKFPLKTGQAITSAKNMSIENTKLIETQEITIADIENHNVDMVATTFDMDYRLLEVEWALEDAGLVGVTLTKTFNINKKGVVTMALSRYEQAKIMILGGAYDKATLTRQLTRYLEKNLVTQEEYDELIALMEARELVEAK